MFYLRYSSSLERYNSLVMSISTVCCSLSDLFCFLGNSRSPRKTMEMGRDGSLSETRVPWYRAVNQQPMLRQLHSTTLTRDAKAQHRELLEPSIPMGVWDVQAALGWSSRCFKTRPISRILYKAWSVNKQWLKINCECGVQGRWPLTANKADFWCWDKVFLPWRMSFDSVYAGKTIREEEIYCKRSRAEKTFKHKSRGGIEAIQRELLFFACKHSTGSLTEWSGNKCTMRIEKLGLILVTS